MGRTVHCCIDVRGALTNWSDRELKGMFKTNDGKSMSATEVKAVLLNELAKGHEVLPFEKCEGFDFSGGGCPGHDMFFDFGEVKTAVSNATRRQDLCDIAERVDAQFMQHDLVMTDENWKEFTVLLGDKERSLSE